MEIKICPVCKGVGFNTSNDRFDGYVEHACVRCNSTGRIEVRTFSYDVPFGSDPAKHNQIDDQIVQWIRLIGVLINKDAKDS